MPLWMRVLLYTLKHRRLPKRRDGKWGYTVVVTVTEVIREEKLLRVDPDGTRHVQDAIMRHGAALKWKDL